MRAFNVNITWLGIKFDAEANVSGCILAVGVIALIAYITTA